MTDQLTHDAFLDGRVHVWQPQTGYRAGTDPVLLAASVNAKSGQSVLELGCGVGTASLCLSARVPRLRMTGVELQPTYAELAQKNAAENNADMMVVSADLRALPSAIRQKQFDHVIMNPPYFDRALGSRSGDAGRDVAFGGDTLLRDWLDVGIKRLAPKSFLTIILKIDRLPEVIAAIEGRLGSIVVLPIAPRKNTPANLFILRGRQDGRTPFTMRAPLFMHEGDAHDGDRENYTPRVNAILRDAAALSLND